MDEDHDDDFYALAEKEIDAAFASVGASKERVKQTATKEVNNTIVRDTRPTSATTAGKTTTKSPSIPNPALTRTGATKHG
ncbi:hypothetical protein BGZ82_002457, partial [Podila clonocystis]